VVACLIASGPHLIETLYDERYHDAGWIIRVLAMGVWFQVLQVPSGSALMALGIPRWLAWANGCKLAGMIAVVPAGFWLHGMQGAVVGLASCEILRYVVFVIGAHRQKATWVRRPWSRCWPPRVDTWDSRCRTPAVRLGWRPLSGQWS
jgi:O-antigen/teichoic acid export membrane protein